MIFEAAERVNQSTAPVPASPATALYRLIVYRFQPRIEPFPG
jgi:hypothetical protein